MLSLEAFPFDEVFCLRFLRSLYSRLFVALVILVEYCSAFLFLRLCNKESVE